MEETLNSVNDEQIEVVVDQDNPVDDGQNEVVDVQQEPEEKPEPKPQTAEENRFFAQRRREEAAKHAQEHSSLQELEKELRQMGFTGSTQDIAAHLRAQRTGESVDAVKAQQQQELVRQQESTRQQQMMQELIRENAQLRQQQFEKIYADDAKEIRKNFPDSKVKDTRELGEEYRKLRQAGVGNLEAFSAVKAAAAAKKPKVPPSIGAVGSSAGKVKDFYTPDEVDKLTDEQLDDPKIWAAVRNSMTKW